MLSVGRVLVGLLLVVVAGAEECGDDGRPRLGIGMTSTTPESQAANHLGIDDGVLVAAIIPGGAAEGMGVLGGDVITSVDGQPIRGMSDLRDAVMAHVPGDPVSVQVARDGQRLALAGQLGTWPKDEPYFPIDPRWERSIKDQQRRALQEKGREVADLRRQLDQLQRDLASRDPATPRDPALSAALQALAALPAWRVDARWSAADAVASERPQAAAADDDAHAPGESAPWRIEHRYPRPAQP